jgi:hypothetical protein
LFSFTFSIVDSIEGVLDWFGAYFIEIEEKVWMNSVISIKPPKGGANLEI